MWLTYTTFSLAVLCLMVASALLGYVWCLRVEDKATEEAEFWRRVAHEWQDTRRVLLGSREAEQLLDLLDTHPTLHEDFPALVDLDLRPEVFHG